MKIEQNTFILSGDAKGYIDFARAFSALNGKALCQTKRHDGKYKPLTYLIRMRALAGTATIEYLNSGYPTRNAVVLAGAARDRMLKSAGVSRSNLESYQKELRILMDSNMKEEDIWLPNSTKPGTSDSVVPGGGGVGDDAYGFNLTYDYTDLVHADGTAADVDVRGTLCMLGSSTIITNSLGESFFPVIKNWKEYRHSFTPATADNDIAENAFSKVMQQGQTADSIIDIVEDEQDEKPYNLDDFVNKVQSTIVSTAVGSPVSSVHSFPLGLCYMNLTNGAVEFELVGVTEL
jgi:hypothetical protein